MICGICNEEIKDPDPKDHKCPAWAKMVHSRFVSLHHRILKLEREVGYQPKNDTKRTLTVEKIADLYEKINKLTKPKEE